MGSKVKVIHSGVACFRVPKGDWLIRRCVGECTGKHACMVLRSVRDGEGSLRSDEGWETVSQIPEGPHLAAETWQNLFDFVGKSESHQYKQDVLLILKALKLAADALQRQHLTLQADGHLQLQRAMSTASIMIGLRSYCRAVDAEAIAASLVMLEVSDGRLSVDRVNAVLGPVVASLVSASTSLWSAISDVEVLDDSISQACREQCMSVDARVAVASLAHVLDNLRHCTSMERYKQQEVALEAVMVFTPVASALGLPFIADEMENRASRILFPASHNSSKEWLAAYTHSGQNALAHVKETLLEAINTDLELSQLFDRVEVLDRVKSLRSFMRKVLSLDKISAGGRQKSNVFDILGLRVIVHPRKNSQNSEDDAIQACYKILNLLHTRWVVVPDRLKDYIVRPKPNGYQSLHTTLQSDKHGHMLDVDTTMTKHADPVNDNLVLDGVSLQEPNENVSNRPSEFDAVESADHKTPLTSVNMGRNEKHSRTGEKLYGGCKDVETSDELLCNNEYEEKSHVAEVFEVQIRTKMMDDCAESGSSAHVLYKTGITSTHALASQGHITKQLPGDVVDLAGFLSE